ncbi:MAG: CiaB protein, partial [Campylobacterales bacterium]
ESDEVEPYYVEGLLHLSLFFKVGILSFDLTTKKLIVDMSSSKLRDAKDIYFETYRDLATYYVDKKDSKEFLTNFVVQEDRFKPKDRATRAFVEHYWNRYLAIGQKVDSLARREEWI